MFSLYFDLIPQRLERRTYFYQKYALPIKLRNLYFKSIQIWTENTKFEASYFTIKLYSLKENKKYRKRGDSNTQCKNTIFSKYLALPIATFPLRVKPATIRHLSPWQGDPLPIKLLTLWLVEFESTHFVWKTNSLPLTYSHLRLMGFEPII